MSSILKLSKDLILFSGPITQKNLIKLTLTIDDLSPGSKLIISSRGGDLEATRAGVEAIQRKELTTIARGNVFSSAAFLYLAGSKRLIESSSTLLLHEPRFSIEPNLTFYEMQIQLKNIEMTRSFFLEFLRKQSCLLAFCEYEIPAKDCISLGISDEYFK